MRPGLSFFWVARSPQPAKQGLVDEKAPCMRMEGAFSAERGRFAGLRALRPGWRLGVALNALQSMRRHVERMDRPMAGRPIHLTRAQYGSSRRSAAQLSTAEQSRAEQSAAALSRGRVVRATRT